MSQQYQGSEAYKSTMTSTYKQLVNRKRHAKMAVAMVTDKERAFFEADLALIEKRMKQLAKDAQS